MRKIVFYFDNKSTKIFVEKVTETGEKKAALSTPYNFVYAGEVVAKIIDIDSDDQIPSRIEPNAKYYNVQNYIPVKTDSGIYFDQLDNSFKASEYGFVVFDGTKLKLLSPLSFNKEKTKASFTIHPTKAGRVPGIKDIKDHLQEFKIIASVPEKELEEQLSKIDVSNPKPYKVVVARGKDPVDGHEEYFLPIISLDKKAGEVLPDGRINFREVGSIIQVVKNQEILERFPAVKPVDGYDIYGNKIEAKTVNPEGLKKGDNIVQSGHDQNIFLAAIDGCVDVTAKKVTILPIAIIKGDVNFETGNIDFNGSVHVKGSVHPGFTVKASTDIIIENLVEDAVLHAGGDITIKSGVVGKEAVRLVAGGKVTAKYLLNAKVEAAGEIIIEDSIINCDVFSNDKITVAAKQGKIIGGKSFALYDIIVNVAGSPSESETHLSVGRNLFIEKELDSIRKDISVRRGIVEEVIRKLKTSFGESVFQDPKQFLSILPPVKKKTCLELLKELGNSNRELKELTEKAKEVQDRLKLEREPYIVVKDKIYPGTTLSIKKSVRKIDKIMDNAKFYEDPAEKSIRFISAV